MYFVPLRFSRQEWAAVAPSIFKKYQSMGIGSLSSLDESELGPKMKYTRCVFMQYRQFPMTGMYKIFFFEISRKFSGASRREMMETE